MFRPIFSGIKVIDLTKVFSGPFATRMFADYGAEVIKIEHPDFPDESRSFPPLKKQKNTQWSGYFEVLNRGKKSLTLDLKTASDRETFYTLIVSADILVENLSPSAKKSLQIEYERLSSLNPRLIYASLSGVGQTSSRKYYDSIAQAESGLLSLSGTPAEPMKIGPSVVDAFSGMTLAFGVASALFNREKTGLGQYLDTDMLSCSLQLLEANLTESSVSHSNPQRLGNQDTAIAPFGVYKTSNGSLVVAAGNDGLWNAFAGWLQPQTTVNLSVFRDNETRLKLQKQLTTTIEAVFANYTTDQLIESLEKLAVPAGRVREMLDVLADESLYKNGALLRVVVGDSSVTVPGKPVRFFSNVHTPATSAEKYVAAPKLGEHSDEYR